MNGLVLPIAVVSALGSPPGFEFPAAVAEVLPPLLPWDGASRELTLPPDSEWVTPLEKTGYRTTPRYDETVRWLERLAAAAPELTLTAIGTSFLFIPILNVDGHERFSPFNRINQRGPEAMGWRTNRRNLNLNRDFAKLDTDEVRALVATLERYAVDLYLDLHVTDGADYQYDVTWGATAPRPWSPHIARWLDATLTPALTRDLEAHGHTPGPLVFAVDERDMSGGSQVWAADPRYSNGYGDARHLPTVLVENHSLKPYEQRVLGTYVLLKSALRTLGRDYQALRRAVAADRAARPAELVLEYDHERDAAHPTAPFKAVRSETYASAVSGGVEVRWTGEPRTEQVARVADTVPKATATRPRAYYIPAAWRAIAERLQLHGIAVERLDAGRTVEVEMYRLREAHIDSAPFEGHVRVVPGPVARERRTLALAPGSYRASTDQPLGDLLMLLLEPESPDSFFQWGFLLEMLQRTEYVEGYVMEPLARRMLAADPALEAEFLARLASDPEFAADRTARLQWFYERTPYFDDEYRLYPIARSPTE